MQRILITESEMFAMDSFFFNNSTKQNIKIGSKQENRTFIERSLRL